MPYFYILEIEFITKEVSSTVENLTNLKMHILPADLALTKNSTKSSRKEVANRKRSRWLTGLPILTRIFMDFGNLQTTSLQRKYNLKPKEVDRFTYIYEIFEGLQKFADDKSNKNRKTISNQTTNLKKKKKKKNP